MDPRRLYRFENDIFKGDLLIWKVNEVIAVL